MSRRHREIRRAVATGIALAALGATAASADGERYSGGGSKSYSETSRPDAVDSDYSSWTGPYIGMGIGARDNQIDWTTTKITTDAKTGVFHDLTPDSPTSSNFDSVGVQFKGFAGYNLQLNGVVVGVEGEISGAGDASSRTRQVFPGANNIFNIQNSPNTFDNIKAGSDVGGSVRARFGTLIRKNMLLYATGGLAIQRFNFTASCQGTLGNSSLCTGLHSISRDTTKIGWTLGAGLEAQLTKHWFARIEYAYSAFGSENLNYRFPGDAATNGETATLAAKVDLNTQSATVGIAYKF